MLTKVLINLSQGILEVEGEQEFVREMCQDFKTELQKLAVLTKTSPINMPQIVHNPALNVIQGELTKDALQPNATKKSAPKKVTGKKETYSMMKELSMGEEGQSGSLYDYVSRYNPTTNLDRNVVFTKYLMEEHASVPITCDTIYTCYVNANIKNMPGSIRSSLKDTANASKGYGYIDTSDYNNIKVVYRGENRLKALMNKALEPKVAA